MIRVAGKEKPVKVYELIDKKGEIPEAKRDVLNIYEDGLREYQKREWNNAFFRKKSGGMGYRLFQT